MKILMVDSLINSNYTFWLCRGLVEAGHEVELVTLKNHKDVTGEPFLILPMSPAKDTPGNKILKIFEYVYFLFWLWIYIIRARADIVHFQFFRRERSESLYFPMMRLFCKNLIFTAHNIIPHENNKTDYYLRYLVYKSATKVIVHTNSIKTRLLEMFDIPPEKVYVVPAVLATAEEPDVSVTKEIAREFLNLSDADYVLLFFGYIRDYKGLDWLLEAFDMIKPKHDQLKLLVAGKPHNTELHALYTEQINGMTYRDDVIFVPEYIPDEEVDYYFVAADAVAVPYKEIYLSAVLQVAFSYSKPVIVTNVGNFRNLVEQGENGYITNQNTPEELAEMIDLAFQDIDNLLAMGPMAYERHKSHPDWQEIGAMTIDVYQK